MDMLATDELLARVKRSGDRVTVSLVVRRFVANESRRHHAAVARHRLFEAHLKMIGLPRIVIVEDGNKAQLWPREEPGITVELINAGVPGARRATGRTHVTQHGHTDRLVTERLNLPRERRHLCARHLLLGMIDHHDEPIGKSGLPEDRRDGAGEE